MQHFQHILLSRQRPKHGIQNPTKATESDLKHCLQQSQLHVQTLQRLAYLVPLSYVKRIAKTIRKIHFTTNKFMYGYQEFVNTYGIPRYREANPALFTAATFPFLFGVMYGDIGHGLYLFLAACFLVFNEKKNDKARLGEMAAGMHAGRYMILMMGFFAVYTGLIYNDAFSLGINFFGSRWYYEGQYKGEVVTNTKAEPTAQFGSDIDGVSVDSMESITSNPTSFGGAGG